MKVGIVCTSRAHPIYPHLVAWADARKDAHDVVLANTAAELTGGDILFLISCNEIVSASVREKYRYALVVHASALPLGRGMSPHIWQVLEGSHSIPVTLLEASDSVDSGQIWAQRHFELEGHELYDEINAKLFEATLQLMDFALENAGTVSPQPQANIPPTYYRKRTPADSELDPQKSIAEQFDLLRVADPERFPCFFDYRGKRFRVYLRKESK